MCIGQHTGIKGDIVKKTMHIPIVKQRSKAPAPRLNTLCVCLAHVRKFSPQESIRRRVRIKQGFPLRKKAKTKESLVHTPTPPPVFVQYEQDSPRVLIAIVKNPSLKQHVKPEDKGFLQKK